MRAYSNQPLDEFIGEIRDRLCAIQAPAVMIDKIDELSALAGIVDEIDELRAQVVGLRDDLQQALKTLTRTISESPDTMTPQE